MVFKHKPIDIIVIGDLPTTPMAVLPSTITIIM